jgi:hypothetical protein
MCTETLKNHDHVFAATLTQSETRWFSTREQENAVNWARRK